MTSEIIKQMQVDGYSLEAINYVKRSQYYRLNHTSTSPDDKSECKLEQTAYHSESNTQARLN